MPNLEYAEAPEDEFNYEADWKEAVDGEQAPSSTGAISQTDQTGTLVGYVPHNKFRSAVRYFVGHSSCDQGAPYRLYREPPAHFPPFPAMRCFAAGFQPRILRANPQGTVTTSTAWGTVLGEVAYVPNDDTPWLNWLGQPVRTGLYHETTLNLNFRSFGRVAFLPDTSVVTYRDEWKRYCRFSVDPQTEVLAAENAAQLRFDEGEPGPPAGQGGLGLPFPVAVAEVLAKAAFSVTVFNLPHDYISTDPVYLYPRRFIEALGTANSVEFLGHPKYTMLLTAVKFEEVLFPVAPDLPDYPVTGWTATCVWEQFDPPKGVLVSEYRGHVVFPFRKTGKWYHAKRESGQEYVPVSDHHKLLQHVDDPS